MNIGKFRLRNNLFLAPIAGFSDIGARALAWRYGAGLAYTEMVSAKGLYYNNANTATLLATSPYEEVKACQLFGSNPSVVAEVLKSPKLQTFEIIDFNMGCPVPKVVKNGEGSALLNNPTLVYDLVKAAVQVAGDRAVTAKLRAGFKKGETLCVETALAVEEAGGAAVTIHGRRREDYYSGVVDYAPIRAVKEAVSIPVIGNGDVKDGDSLHRMLSETGVDGVAIARGALGRPYLFSLLQGLGFTFDVVEAVSFQIAEMLKIYPDRKATADLKKQIPFYVKGLKAAKEIKAKVFAATSTADIVALLKQYV